MFLPDDYQCDNENAYKYVIDVQVVYICHSLLICKPHAIYVCTNTNVWI